MQPIRHVFAYVQTRLGSLAWFHCPVPLNTGKEVVCTQARWSADIFWFRKVYKKMNTWNTWPEPLLLYYDYSETGCFHFLNLFFNRIIKVFTYGKWFKYSTSILVSVCLCYVYPSLMFIWFYSITIWYDLSADDLKSGCVRLTVLASLIAVTFNRINSQINV